MSTIKQKLEYLEETKELIRQAIIDKGILVSLEDTFREYADKINSIPEGGSGIPIHLVTQEEYDAIQDHGIDFWYIYDPNE